MGPKGPSVSPRHTPRRCTFVSAVSPAQPSVHNIGVFGTVPRKPDDLALPVIGEVLHRDTFRAPDGDLLRYDLTDVLVVDATHIGNECRWVNNSCEPNCELRHCWASGKMCYGLFAILNIAVGDELTFKYDLPPVRSPSSLAHHTVAVRYCRGRRVSAARAPAGAGAMTPCPAAASTSPASKARSTATASDRSGQPDN